MKLKYWIGSYFLEILMVSFAILMVISVVAAVMQNSNRRALCRAKGGELMETSGDGYRCVATSAFIEIK